MDTDTITIYRSFFLNWTQEKFFLIETKDVKNSKLLPSKHQKFTR